MVRRVSLRLEEFGSSFWKITIKANFNHRNFVSQYICRSPYRHQPLKTSMIMSLMQFQFGTSFIEHVYSYIRIFLVIFQRIEVAAWFDPTTDVKGNIWCIEGYCINCFKSHSKLKSVKETTVGIESSPALRQAVPSKRIYIEGFKLSFRKQKKKIKKKTDLVEMTFLFKIISLLTLSSS